MSGEVHMLAGHVTVQQSVYKAANFDSLFPFSPIPFPTSTTQTIIRSN